MDVMTTLKAAKRCWRFGVFPFLSSFFVTVTLLALYSPHGANQISFYNFPNIFTLSSFAVVSETLTELNLVATEIGQIALSSAMISEILQWITMELHFNSSGPNGQLTLQLLLGCCGFAVLCLFIIRPLVNIVVERTPPGKPMKEIYVVMILLGVLVMAGISDIFGIYFIMGPILYGFVLPNGPPLATTIIERSELLVKEFFMPFFFLHIGTRTDLTKIPNDWKEILTFQAILFVGFLVKVLACVLVSPTYNIKLKHGVVLGLILNVKGIIELIFYSRMYKLEVIDTEIYGVAVVYVLSITSLCIPLIKSLYRHRRVLKTPTIHEGSVRTIQNISENTEFRIVSCVHTDEHVHSMIALIEACNPTTQSPICVFVVHLIELFGKSTPILLPMNKRNRKSLSVNYPNTNHILRAFENYSNNSSGPVTILSHVNVAPYKSMHEAVCNLAEDSSVHLLIVPFHQNDQTMCSHVATTIRDLNTSFLANATGTVGILVDRYSVLSGSSSKLSFHVGIFFIGGKDDREALALGIRMLERPNTRVTLFRFVLHDKNDSGFVIDRFVENEEEKLESTLDESLIDEFKANNIISSDSVNIVYHEVVVEDCIQVLEAIRGMESDYDLVMVGKRHSMGDLTEEEMSNFMDNANQLGIFGDMLASNEFCNGKVPVLVMRCGEQRVEQLEKVGPCPPPL
ncbi:Cation/H(+) antiporter 15 [Spatholobus suberectus]|nr:Cation/H(+) antiporter 15 [Spatholobus suberectus]